MIHVTCFREEFYPISIESMDSLDDELRYVFVLWMLAFN